MGVNILILCDVVLNLLMIVSKKNKKSTNDANRQRHGVSE